MDNLVTDKMQRYAIRINTIQYLPLCFADETINDSIKEAVEGGDLDDLFPGISECEFIDDYLEERMETDNRLYLVHFQTPIKNVHKHAICSYSWGLCNCFWINGNSLQDCCEQAIEWVRNKYALTK